MLHTSSPSKSVVVTTSRKSDWIEAATFGSDEAYASLQYRLRNDGMVELVARFYQRDEAVFSWFEFEPFIRISEPEYAEDEATDLEIDAREFVRQLGVVGTASGRFSETVAAAVDRAASFAIAAE